MGEEAISFQPLGSRKEKNPALPDSRLCLLRLLVAES
jgi:hypothetical protein